MRKLQTLLAAAGLLLWLAAPAQAATYTAYMDPTSALPSVMAACQDPQGVLTDPAHPGIGFKAVDLAALGLVGKAVILTWSAPNGALAAGANINVGFYKIPGATPPCGPSSTVINATTPGELRFSTPGDVKWMYLRPFLYSVVTFEIRAA